MVDIEPVEAKVKLGIDWELGNPTPVGDHVPLRERVYPDAA